MRRRCRWFAAFLLFPSLAPLAAERDRFFLRDGQKVVFLGDSITFADHYLVYVETFLRTRQPDLHVDLINRGLPSETVAGTSEPAHDPARPDLFSRFDRTVPPLKPDVVVACYGMNDGLYRPPDEAIFARYTNGITRLLERITELKAQPILMTPPPFDPLPFRNQPASDPPDWRRPALNYDDTLEGFRIWLVTHRPRVPVVDVHHAVNQFLGAAREADPSFRLASDGIHLNETGHLLIAQALLRAWNAPAQVSDALINASQKRSASRDVGGLEFLPSGAIRFQWRLVLPMPVDPAWDTNVLALAGFAEQLNRFRLRVVGLKEASYDLEVDGQPVATLSRLSLQNGVDLNTLETFPTVRRAAEVLDLVKRRRQLLTELRVRDDPHPRLAGLFKDSKATAAEVEALDARLRELCRSRDYKIELLPVGEQ